MPGPDRRRSLDASRARDRGVDNAADTGLRPFHHRRRKSVHADLIARWNAAGRLSQAPLDQVREQLSGYLAGDQTRIGACFPRTGRSPTSASLSAPPFSSARVDSAMKSECGVPLVIPSSRDAVFVVSPIAVYSSRRSWPTLPDISGPLFKPMPIRSEIGR